MMTHQSIFNPYSTDRLATRHTKAVASEDEIRAGKAEFKQLRDELRDLQRALFAERSQSLLAIFQAPDCGGKDSVIRKVFSGVDPKGIQVASFKKPTAVEWAHDFLWRIHPHAPRQGMISVFNRSHYEDVLVPVVDNSISDAALEQRYKYINAFESSLQEKGTVVLKFYLHISKDEHRRRLQQRLDQPHKNWKFDPEDLLRRKVWHEYQLAYENTFNHCSSDEAPWHIIPADDKWWRNLLVMRILTSAIRTMNPQFPESKHDLTNVVIT